MTSRGTMSELYFLVKHDAALQTDDRTDPVFFSTMWYTEALYTGTIKVQDSAHTTSN